MDGNKKVRKNLITGIVGLLVSIGLGILLPRLILTQYGSEINGLLTSVTNIYAYIAIVEAGVAAASCQALYKSIADNDKDGINEILSATNVYYHRTGIVYFCLIIVFAVLYPTFVKSEIPYHVIFLVILFNGIGNVVNYFFHGKYLILLKADGKNYIRTGLETIINVLKQVSKIVLISMGFDVVFAQLAAMLVSILQMLMVVVYIKKYYSWIDLKATPNFSAISQRKYVLFHEINYLITANVDTVVLTFVTNLKTVSVYSMYTMLYGMIGRVLKVVKDAVEFKLAFFFHKDRQEFLQLFEAYETYYVALAFSLFTIAGCFISPFLRVYTRGVNDVNYLQPLLPGAFLLVHLLETMRYPYEAMIHISGHFKQTKASAVIETGLNVLLSVIFGYRFGILGVLTATIISFAYRAAYLAIYINKHILGRDSTKIFCY